ncbi:unnamed protein product [Auanema sp. JU1783]|nr:unnamed protein product [Auanema sp. JU1783]
MATRRIVSAWRQCRLLENKLSQGKGAYTSRFASTHFGFQQVEETEKEKKVHEVFANVAEKYDLMNDAMSMGVHRLWKDYYVGSLPLKADSNVLDVAGGTGDIAFRLSRRINRGNVTVFDINQNMLNVGMERVKNEPKVEASRLSWVCGNAEALPFEDNKFDLYTISFGIRNCTHVDKVISEAFRVLKPGGMFTVLEFSAVSPLLRPIYDAYSFNVIPVMGEVLASDYHSYKYLVESIRKFPDQDAFAGMIRTAGFDGVRYENLTFGVCAIHKGIKPKSSKKT